MSYRGHSFIEVQFIVQRQEVIILEVMAENCHCQEKNIMFNP